MNAIPDLLYLALAGGLFLAFFLAIRLCRFLEGEK